MHRLLAPLAGLAAAAVTTAAHAEPHLDYRAVTGCPADTEFVAAVRARGGSVELTGASNDEIDVAIERASDGYRGTVRVTSTGLSSEAREVRSTECGEVADGLAIVTALASQTGSLPDATSTPATNTAPLVQNETKPMPPATPTAKPAASTRLHTAGQFHEETLKVASGEVRVRSDTAYSLAGGVLLGIASGNVIPRVDLTLARTNFITTPDGAGHIVGGILRTRWTVLLPTDYRKDAWSAQFFALRASIGACSQLAYDLEGLALLVCGEVGAGVAKVTTKDPTGHATKDEVVGLASAAIELDARYHLGRYVYVGATAGSEAWISQIKAVESNGNEIFHTNPVGGYVLAGIGLHFS